MHLELKNKLISWMTDFVEQPNEQLGGFAVCPYARAARANDKIAFKYCTVSEFMEVLRDSMNDLDDKEVVVVAFDHTTIDPVTLQEWVESVNRTALMPNNFVILEDHPDAPEYVNGVRMNFGHSGLLILQRLDRLNEAADALRKQGYYDKWDQNSLDSVVAWRYIHNAIC
jgi:hypothetical protein